MNANDLYKLGMDIQAMLCFINDHIIEADMKQFLKFRNVADKNSPYRKIIELQYKMEDTLNKGMIGYEQEISLYRKQIIPHQTRLLDHVYRLALNEQIFVLGFVSIDDMHPVLIPSEQWRALKISIENDEASFNDKQYFALRFLKPMQLLGNELDELKTELAANNKRIKSLVTKKTPPKNEPIYNQRKESFNLWVVNKNISITDLTVEKIYKQIKSDHSKDIKSKWNFSLGSFKKDFWPRYSYEVGAKKESGRPLTK